MGKLHKCSTVPLQEINKTFDLIVGMLHQCSVIICPGIHDPQLTQEFWQRLHKGNFPSDQAQNVLIFPAWDYPAYSAIHILQFLQRQMGTVKPPVIFISFSAGVVGAIGAAWGWQVWGGEVKAFVACDGWGVPLSGNFPIYRVSHDYFTHWSSAVLGTGEDSFYADPAVEHLQVWGKPDHCQGWWVHLASGVEQRTYTTVAQFISEVLKRYL